MTYSMKYDDIDTHLQFLLLEFVRNVIRTGLSTDFNLVRSRVKFSKALFLAALKLKSRLKIGSNFPR